MATFHSGTTYFTNSEGYEFEVEWTCTTSGVIEIRNGDPDGWDWMEIPYWPELRFTSRKIYGVPTHDDIEDIVCNVMVDGPEAYSRA